MHFPNRANAFSQLGKSNGLSDVELGKIRNTQKCGQPNTNGKERTLMYILPLAREPPV